MRLSEVVNIYCGLHHQIDDREIKENNNIADQTHNAVYDLKEASNQAKKFWPVLQAIKCANIEVSPALFHHPYKLIFSSKTAIKFFYIEIIKMYENFFDFCTGIYCVGHESKHYFQAIFGDRGQPIFVPTVDGMDNLIREFALTTLNDTLVFVVAKKGRSMTAINQYTFSLPPQIVPIYDVIPYKSQFLETQISDIITNKQIQIVFECRSGQILAQVSKFLMQYFSCDDIISLPKNIFFSCFGQSTLDKVKELYGQRAG